MDSVTTSVVSWIINGLLGIAMWLLKSAYSDLKADIKENQLEIAKVRDASMKKQDFNDFKQELWGRLDRFEDSIDAKIRDTK